MFDSPYSVLKWIFILMLIGTIIFRFQVFREFFRNYSKNKSKNDEEVQKKVSELLEKFKSHEKNESSLEQKT